MPLIKEIKYQSPRLLFNRHLETIYPALLRRVEPSKYITKEIKTPDDDFLEFDWYKGFSSKNVVIISHGLEGNSTRPYMLGMAKAFTLNDWDAISWNYRGCGSRINKKKFFYHSGATYDLQTIVELAQNHYENIFLVGFSLGGNLTLKYLGEHNRYNQSKITGASVFSVPLNLHSCCIEMEKPHNYLYSKRFLNNLIAKCLAKEKMLENDFSFEHLKGIRSILAFDDFFTAPVHGFKNAIDYYKKNSSIHFLDKINKETLIVNALNDPFLAKDCYPSELIGKLKKVHLEIPDRGGHVGFTSFNKSKIYWSEKRAVEFANSLVLE